MPKSKVPPKPYYAVKHDHAASLKAFEDASMILFQATKSVVQICTTPESALRGLKELEGVIAEYERATFPPD